MRIKSFIIFLFICVEASAQKQPDGEYKEFYKEGSLKTLGQYKDGKAHEVWTYYRQNGSIIKTGSYRDCKFDLGNIQVSNYSIDKESQHGVEDGLWRSYYENGKLRVERTSVCGVRVGMEKHYSNDGKIESESFYSNGQSQLEKEYFKSGAIERLTIFTYYDVKDGPSSYKTIAKAVVSVFYETGELEESYFEDDNELDGLDKNFWRNGFLKYEVMYVNGNRQGVARNYYENGMREIETEYVDGKKNGKLLLYSKTGKLLMRQVWKDDVKVQEEMVE